MKLYDEANPAPNPRRVRIFLAEKGISVPLVHVSLFKREHKTQEFLAKNSLGQLPVLELDDGTTISESVAICRYFEALHPQPPLFGRTAVEQAHVDMWIRRLDLRVGVPLGQVWINLHPLTVEWTKAAGVTRYKDWGEDNKRRCVEMMRWLDREIVHGSFIVGETYTMADIVALTILDFAKFIDIAIPAECAALQVWHERVSARPSAAA